MNGSILSCSSTDQRSDPWRTRSVRIAEIKPEIDGVFTYRLEFLDADEAHPYRFAPGQFNMLYLPGAGEIAISRSDSPDADDGCLHTIRIVGNATGVMARMKVGDTLGLRGPFGAPWPVEQCLGRDVILVAGGIGLAPLRPVVYSLLDQPQRFGQRHLLFGTRTPDDLLFADEYTSWESAGIRVQTTVDRAASGWQGNVGVVTMLLGQLRDFDPANCVLFCCGPEVMMRFTVQTALRRGISSDRIYLSMERNMQCAVGLCGHCQFGPTFVCKDGPVFPYNSIAKLLDIHTL
ncbi:MAG: FAD/NAD(P)-binding protein [Planctomycetaceae bacterium]